MDHAAIILLTCAAFLAGILVGRLCFAERSRVIARSDECPF